MTHASPVAGTANPATGTSPHIGLGPRPEWGFRAPRPPAPIEPFDLCHPSVPPELEGLRILHLSDSHIERLYPRPAHHHRLLDALSRTQADLIFLTGDFMTSPGDEPAALIALDELSHAWRTRFGAFAVRGNHDTARFIEGAQQIPGLRWLSHESVKIPIDLGRGICALRVVGSGFPESLLESIGPPDDSFALALVHYPSEIFAAAELRIPIVLSGHTHGGQVRTHASWLPHTSCDLPGNLASGVFRLRDTVLCISRGLGAAVLPFRVNCPAQAPLYSLRRRAFGSPTCEVLAPIYRW
ncbi:MAG: metallophosphoesterase [Phycisphaerales bacterium]|nr:metallophosphoesterase [Phycisphaerales bacterium]